MKKYQQLLIVSLGIVSFVCFLIYKHEYDRLRNVIEVLEVFGNPPSPAANPPNDAQLEHAAVIAAASDLTNNNLNQATFVNGRELRRPQERSAHPNPNNDIPNAGNSGEVIDNQDRIEDEDTGVGVAERQQFPLRRRIIHNNVFEKMEKVQGKN